MHSIPPKCLSKTENLHYYLTNHKMEKPNFLQKAADFLGFSTERVEKMSADEKAKLSSMGEKTANLETERDQAIKAKEAAESTATDLQAQLDTATNDLQAANDTIAERDETITGLQSQVSELEGKLSKVSAEDPIKIKKTAEETVPGDKGNEKKIHSWEEPLYRNKK